GIGLEEMVDTLAEERAFELRAEQIGREDVWNFFEEIAGVRAAFDSNADLAKLFDPAPDGGARDADFAGDAGTADGDGGVVGEESDKSGEAFVGGVRQRGSGHRGGSLLVLDGVDKQAEIGGGGGMRERAGGEEVGAGFGVGADVFEGDAAGNFD